MNARQHEEILTPRQVELNRAQGWVELLWQDNSRDRISFQRLRGNCGCSSCRAARLRDRFRIEPDVSVVEVRLFGVSGLQLVFSDGHERGVFPWRFLKELADTPGKRDLMDPSVSAGLNDVVNPSHAAT